MKMNLDCIRDIMIYVEDSEELGLEGFANSTKLQQELQKYTEDEIKYSLVMLKESGLAVVGLQSAGGNIAYYADIRRLTSEGHEFIQNIRDEGTYKKVKEKAKKIGTFTLSIVADLGKYCVQQQITNLLNP